MHSKGEGYSDQDAHPVAVAHNLCRDGAGMRAAWLRTARVWNARSKEARSKGVGCAQQGSAQQGCARQGCAQQGSMGAAARPGRGAEDVKPQAGARAGAAPAGTPPWEGAHSGWSPLSGGCGAGPAPHLCKEDCLCPTFAKKTVSMSGMTSCSAPVVSITITCGRRHRRRKQEKGG